VAVKLHGRYFSGEIYDPAAGHHLTEELPDVRDDGAYGSGWDCPGCGATMTPVSSYERFEKITRQALCSECGYGLTPCEELN
jgi:hypothetical protein